MLTFLLICVAVIAIIQLILRCAYFIFVWLIARARQWVAEKRKPKPPVPPKPIISPIKAQNAASETEPTIETNSEEQSKKEEETKITTSDNTIFSDSLETQPNGNSSSSKRLSPTPSVTRLNSDLKKESSPQLLTVNPRSLASMAREESLDSMEEDICCTNFASLIKQRAKGFTQPYSPARGRSPPAKPPKPSAEAIAKARLRNSSFGDDIPAGKEGFRYADDESTESSVDYKDVVFDHGRVVAIELKEKPFTNEEKFELMLRQYTPTPPPSLRYDHNQKAPKINIELYDDDYDNVFVPSAATKASEISLESFKTAESDISLPSVKNYKNTRSSNAKVSKPNPPATTEDDTTGNFGTSDTRHSWPATKRRKKFKRLPPARPPPPPAAEKETKTVSFSDDETSFHRRGDRLLLSTLQKDKPPRPPPPATKPKPRLPPKNKAPVPPPPPSPRVQSPKRQTDQKRSLPPPPPSKGRETVPDQSDPRRSILVTKSATIPRPPPRQRRFRSRTIELTSATWRQSLPEVSRRRTLSLSDRDNTGMSDNELRTGVCSDTDKGADKDATALKSLYTKVNKQQPPSLSIASLPGYDRKEKSPVPQEQYSRKFQFRPLPPPPAPPRTHPKKGSSTSQLDASPLPNEAAQSYHDYDVPRPEEVQCKTENAPKLPVKQRTNSTNSNSAANGLQRSNSKTSEVKTPIRDKLIRRDSREKRTSSRFYSDLGPEDVIHLGVASAATGRSLSTSPMPRTESPGRSLDLEEGGHTADIDSSLNSSRQTSVERSNSGVSGFVWSSKYRRSDSNKSNRRSPSNRSSTFYCDLPAGGQEEAEISEQDQTPKTTEDSELASKSSRREKSVQTSPELSAVSDQAVDEDSDELMDIANNLRMELNSILLRHQSGQPKLPTSRSLHHQDSDSEKSSTTGESQGEEYKMRHRLPTLGSTRSSEASWANSTDESEEEVSSSAASSTGNLTALSPEEKQRKRLFYIAKELMTSEENFVDALRLLNVSFQGAVRKASLERGAPIVPDEIMTSIFRYLPQLQNLNENLLSEIKERVQNWESSQKISDVLVKIGPFLKLYSCYIRDFENMTLSLDESCRKYPLFSQTVKEFELSPQCQKLALKHFLLKPVQRIPQYRLLLQDYLNHLSRDSEDYDDTNKALKIVSEVADHANETMKQGDNFLKLVSIQNSLMTRHEIVKPGRVFLKEGELMKLSRKVPQPRWFILFNDSLLYLTSVQQGVYRVNHELPLTGMKVSVTKQADYGNEFSIISVTRSFSLAAKTEEEREEWISLLNHAIDENAVKRSSFLNMQMQQKNLPSKLNETMGASLGMRAPVWIPDTRVTMCQLCTTEFTITYRRHHCRACGRVVCSSCSANRAGLKYLSYRSVRVCNACYVKLKEEYDLAVAQGQSSEESASGERRPLSEPPSDGLEDRPELLNRSESDLMDTRRPVRFLKPSNGVNASGGRKKKYLPSVLKEVRANDQGSDISGYLHLFGRRDWKRYWFVLKSKVLYTYKASEDVAALKSTPLLGFEIKEFTELQEGVDGSLTFKLVHKGHPHMLFYAETVGFAERWVKAMRKAIVLE